MKMPMIYTQQQYYIDQLVFEQNEYFVQICFAGTCLFHTVNLFVSCEQLQFKLEIRAFINVW